MAERKWKLSRLKIIYGAVASALFISCFWAGIAAENTEETSFDIVCLGDSILGQARDATSIPAILGRELNVSVFNGAFGGTNMSRKSEDRSITYFKDSLSMAALSLAIGYEDFGPQQTVASKENGTEYFEETVDRLEEIDFHKVETLIIGYGTNDYNGGTPIENPENLYDTYTYAGALRFSLEALQKNYPHLRIILLAPTYSWFLAKKETCEEWNSGYGYLEDYVDAVFRVAEEFQVEVVDLYHDFYPHEKWEDYARYTTDGLHPNEKGRELIAGKLAEYLNDNPVKRR